MLGPLPKVCHGWLIIDGKMSKLKEMVDPVLVDVMVQMLLDTSY